MVEWLEETFRWTDEQRLEKQRRRAGRKVAKFLAKKHKLEKKKARGWVCRSRFPHTTHTDLSGLAELTQISESFVVEERVQPG